MLNKCLFLLLVISSSVIAMEINECAVQIVIDDTEILLRKVSAILKDQELSTQSIIKDLLTKESDKRSSPEQRQQKEVIIRKITESDE